MKNVEYLQTRIQVIVGTKGAKSSIVKKVNTNNEGKSNDDDNINNIVDGLAKLYISAEVNLNSFNSNDDDDDNSNI